MGFAAWLASKVLKIGYIGIILLMALESSFFPFPSEVVMIPSGYLAAKGLMNPYFAVIAGIIGSIIGAAFNYWLADRFGRDFLHKHAKWFFTSEKTLEKIERFFYRHGIFSTFFGRLIPVVRQYISFPAGLAKMPFWTFVLFTALGAGIWCVFLVYLGYFIGENTALIKQYLNQFTIWVIFFVALISIIYFSAVYKLWHRIRLPKFKRNK